MQPFQFLTRRPCLDFYGGGSRCCRGIPQPSRIPPIIPPQPRATTKMDTIPITIHKTVVQCILLLSRFRIASSTHGEIATQVQCALPVSVVMWSRGGSAEERTGREAPFSAGNVSI